MTDHPELEVKKERKPRRKHVLKAAGGKGKKATRPKGIPGQARDDVSLKDPDLKTPRHPALAAGSPPAAPDISPYIINHTDFYTTAVLPHQYPTTGWPEVAFVGKSNVGKSSLINAMLGRKRLARTSGTPGKTRTINFFHVEEKLLFADLPGYGYARISKSESEKWGQMIESYLSNRPTLRHIFILVDIRHEPGENDRMIFDWCRHYGLAFTVIATKADKLKRSQVDRHLAIIRKNFGLANPPLAFSSDTNQGRDQLWAFILDNTGIDVL